MEEADPGAGIIRRVPADYASLRSANPPFTLSVDRSSHQSSMPTGNRRALLRGPLLGLDWRFHHLGGSDRGDLRDRGRGSAAQEQVELAAAEHDQSEPERNDIIQQSKQKQPCEQLLLVELPQRDQHRRVENTDAAGGVTGETEERSRTDDNDQPD